MAKYYGVNEIKKVEETGEKTPYGTKIMKVTLSDGVEDAIRYMSHTNLQQFETKESCDLTLLKEKKLDKISTLMLGLLMEYDLEMKETEDLVNFALRRANDALERATSIAWFNSDKAWTKGEEFSPKRTLIHADILIKAHVQKEKPVEGKESK